ncbi:hypothetical protein D1872_263750 [compost metagenome]
MANMNRVNDFALDERRKHGAKRQIPALEKAERQNNSSIHDEKNIAHRNIPFSRYDGTEDIKSTGGTADPQ